MLLRFRRVPIVALQVALVGVSNYVAFLLRFDGVLPDWARQVFWSALPWLIVIRALTFVPFCLYQGLWRYTSIYDLLAVMGGVLVSTAVFATVAISPLVRGPYPRSIFLIDALVLTVLLGGLRLGRRVWAEVSVRSDRGGRRVIIYGAGDTGANIAREMRQDRALGLRPIGFVDDDPSKTGQRIQGLRVLGTRAELPSVIARYRPTEIVLALPTAAPKALRAIVRTLEQYKLPIKTLPRLRDLVSDQAQLAQIRPLVVEDLLTRAPVGLDTTAVKRLIQGRRVMVTGAGGSIGSELCRQILQLRPACLVPFDRHENGLHEIRLELEDRRTHVGLHPVLGDVADRTVVEATLARYLPEIVFHAAAYKHVPLMEDHPCEAIKNNVRGTRILAQAAERAGVDRFILVSTDKAANPSSVMGAAKRIAELVVQAQAQGSGTSFSIVRFGNVLASNGSVVPRFLQQIHRGGPVTVTHPDIRRFFMLIPEAVQLMLHAAAQAASGTTCVLDMGDQIKVADMARNLIRLSGLVPDEDIPIEFIGLRPGEKMQEELIGRGEALQATGVEKVFSVVGPPVRPDLMERVQALEVQACTGNHDAVVSGVKALVDGFGAVEATAPMEGAVPSGPSPEACGGLRCPRCGAPALHRSKRRRLGDRLRRHLSMRRPYRCAACGWRGWLERPRAGVSLSVEPAPSIDLSALDLAGAWGPTPKRAFAPRDLY
jgi:FlaA1/EpsC-like NDP-sugar epimerase